MCTHTNEQITDPEDEGDEEKDAGSALEPQRPSPEFTTTNSQGFLSISAGWEEDQDSREGSTSSSTLWSRVEELPEPLKEKVISLKSERYDSSLHLCVFQLHT